MDFRATCDLFGGTVFYDDFRGNLVEIEAEIEQQMKAGPPDIANAAAALILTRAIWFAQKGDLRSASTLLTDLTDDTVYERRWRFRSHVYSSLIALWRERPPLLHPCDFNGPAMLMWTKQTSDENRRPLAFLDRCKQDRDAVTTLDRLEMDVIKLLCTVRGPAVRRARRLNPDSDFYAASAEERQSCEEFVKEILSDVDRTWRACIDLQLPLVAAYVRRLGYELTSMSCFSMVTVTLAALRDEYARNNDEVGLGIYWMLRGDQLASPSHSSPMVLNLDITDHPDEFGGDCSMKPVRNDRDAHSSPEFDEGMETYLRRLPPHTALLARERLRVLQSTSNSLPSSEAHIDLDETYRSPLLCYNEARRHFGLARATRAQAFVLLKESCVLHMADCSPPELFENRHLREVVAKIEESLALCRRSGDSQLEMLASALLLMHSGANLETREAAQNIARWSNTTDNEVLALGMVLLLFKVAAFRRFHCGNLTEAWSVSEHARQMIKTMSRFKTVWVQVMLFQVSLHKSHGQYKRAILWIEFVKDHWHTFITNEASGLLNSDNAYEVAQATVLISKLIQNVVDYIIALTPHTAASIRDDLTNFMLETLDVMGKNGYTQSWLAHLPIGIQYAEAIPSRVRQTARKDGVASWKMMEAFPQDEAVLESTDLQTKGYRINALVDLGEPEKAAVVLRGIRDDAELTHYYPCLSNGTAADDERFALRHRLKSMEEIFLLCIKCRDWHRAKRLLNLLESASPGYSTSVSSYTKLWPWQRCFYAGLVYEHDKQFNLALQYYNQSWLFFLVSKSLYDEPQMQRQLWEMPLVSRLTSALVRRQLSWSRDHPHTTRVEPVEDARFNHRVFKMFAQEADYGDNPHWNEALMFLEAGRTRYVREAASQANDQNLQELLYQYQTWQELRAKPQELRTADEEAEFERLDAIKSQIEEDLAAGPRAVQEPADLEVHDMYAAIPENSIVIYTAISEDGLVVLCVDRTGVKVGYILNEVTPAMISEFVRALHASITEDGMDSDDMIDFNMIVKILSRLLVPPPVERCIAARSHVIFVPSGSLARLPFGVLLFQGKPLQLEREISQVPSLSMLHDLRNRTGSTSGPMAIKVVARPGHPRDPYGHLPMSGIEALCISSLVGETPVDAKNVSRRDFQHYLREANILHVSTHGFDDAAFPFNSRILLKEPFRVLDMLAVRSELALVTFSACLSNLGTASEAGDVQGFSHSVLAAGANAFIGALWRVNDVVTMIQMHLFYIQLFVNPSHNSISKAWFEAVGILYHSDSEFVIRILRSMVQLWGRLDTNGGDPNGFVRNGRRKLERVVRQYESGDVPKDWDFKHPRNWAAFVLVGNGFTQWQRSDEEELVQRLNSLAT